MLRRHPVDAAAGGSVPRSGNECRIDETRTVALAGMYEAQSVRRMVEFDPRLQEQPCVAASRDRAARQLPGHCVADRVAALPRLPPWRAAD
ncbi:hypothetical protein BN2475_110056 [Paraburkholderia ribeironis]|uniref:Uncharacterized protein n=1 Tax=Paraburkholderia ribeironis TaxID=1247936 RepID=A0A1N7RQH8_9BURK|nr:hypothetical protein BN2475_110056 [Paraburkholderia ribeironis]